MKTGFRLGRWVVWPQRDCICGQGGTIHITPKSMAVLECLAKTQGEVVPRNDILDAVWPNADVTDDVLTQSVTELRKAFGDSPQRSEVIETVPRKGLRLMLAVTSVDDDVPDETGDSRLKRASSEFGAGLLFVIVLVIALFTWFDYSQDGSEDPAVDAGASRSIAVLPFVDLSEAKDQRYLTDGLAEELVLRLSALEGLKVIGPRSASILTGKDDPRAAAAEFSVDFVLDGSLRRSGDDLRIVASLVDTNDGAQLWTHTFDREFSAVFDIQDRIAAAVAAALSVELDVGQGRPADWATNNPDAYEEVLRGIELFDFNPEHMEQARRHFTRAAALDPDFVVAWLWLAMINNVAVSDAMTAEERDLRRIGESAIKRALELAPEAVEVLLVASEMHFTAQNWNEAKRNYDRAIERGAMKISAAFTFIRLPQVHFNMLYKLGHVEAQIRLLENVYRLEPYDGTYAQFLPQAYLAAGRLEEAMAEVELAYANPRARYAISHVGLSIALTLGDTGLIEVWLTRILEQAPAKPGDLLVEMYDLLGEQEQALERLRSHAARGSFADLYYVMQWASYYGDSELALEAMRWSGDLWSFWIPLHEPVRGTPGFKQLVSEMGLVDYWREFGWNDYCQPVGADDFKCR